MAYESQWGTALPLRLRRTVPMIFNVVNSAERRGRDEANRENARRMKAKGYAAEDIAEITGLAKEDINAL